ncbi:hypothetical protein [Natrinema sp. 74]|uniref:hypothetical protein n=1 Tax=Natrinema sp. 74 TaxID=3384159 RepID=UPI0038D3B2C1
MRRNPTEESPSTVEPEPAPLALSELTASVAPTALQTTDIDALSARADRWS